MFLHRLSAEAATVWITILFCWFRKRGRQVTGQDRREITREYKLTLTPLDTFCTYVQESRVTRRPAVAVVDAGMDSHRQ